MKLHHLPVLLIVATGAFLRFFHLGDWSLSNDELSGLNRVSVDGLGTMIEFGVRSEGHPAGYHLFMYFWTRWIGDSAELIRLPFAVAGSLTVWLSFLLAKRWAGRTTGLGTSALIATLQFPLVYSQVARPYAFGALAVLAFAYAWTRWTADHKKLFIPLYLLAGIACLYLHYFSFLLAVVIAVSGLFLVPSEQRKTYLLVNVCLALSFVPHLSLFFDQLAQGGIGEWLDPPDGLFPLEHLFLFANESVILTAWLVIGFGLSVFLREPNPEAQRYRKLALLFFLTPLTIGFLYSILRAPVIQHSTLLFSAPFLLILWFSYWPKLTLHNEFFFTLALLAGGAGTTVLGHRYYQQPQFGEIEAVVRSLREIENRVGPENALILSSFNHRFYVDHYYADTTHKPELAIVEPEHGADIARMQQMLLDTRREYVLYAWASRYNPPEMISLIEENFGGLVERNTWYNGETMLFKRGAPAARKIVFETTNQIDTLLSGWKQHNLETDTSFALNADSMLVPFKIVEKLKTHEFSSTWEGHPDTLTHLESLDELFVEASVKALIGPEHKADLVLIFEGAEKNKGWQSAPMHEFHSDAVFNQSLIVRPFPTEPEAEKIKVYVWRPDPGIVLFKDLTVRLIWDKTDPYDQEGFEREYFDR